MANNRKYTLTDTEARSLGLVPNPFRRYRLNQEKLEKFKNFERNQGVLDACKNVGVQPEVAPMIWLKTSKESVRIKNPFFAEESGEEINFTEIYKNIKPIKVGFNTLSNTTALFDRLVYSDVHIGMDPNKDGYAMFDGKWNEEVLFERLAEMVNWTLINQKSNTLYIHDLGDYVDGFNGETTRGGNKLPQNMDNQAMFDIGLKFKLTLIESLAPYFDKIISVNITNCNHSGSFGYMINSAYKTCAEQLYPNCEVVIQRKFVDHYIVGEKCFILSHGKDVSNMKFGYKPKIDANQILKIKDYIDEYNLHFYQCEFSKGDSHQLLLDFSSSKSFEYQNFGAFSPPSDWVKTNF